MRYAPRESLHRRGAAKPAIDTPQISQRSSDFSGRSRVSVE